MFKVIFLPSKRSGNFAPDTNLLDAAVNLGVEIRASCGGKGLCGKCAVKIISNAPPPSSDDLKTIPEKLIQEGWRLACKLHINSDLEVEVPKNPGEALVLSEFGAAETEPDSGIELTTLSIEKASLDNQSSDLERFAKACNTSFSDTDLSLEQLRALHPSIQAADGKLSVLKREGKNIAVIPGNDSPAPIGLAVDIGTTTLAAILVDLFTGENLATASMANPQASRGDDVISRIEYSSRGKKELEELKNSIVSAIQKLANEASEKAGIASDKICLSAIAGNTCMQHLFLGLPVESLGRAPFEPVLKELSFLNASEIGLNFAAGAEVIILPCISGYIGGDIVAGLAVHNMDKEGPTTLFVDIGTNGEMALRHGSKLVSCSTAAGPAFEGARISCGMRATAEAVNSVETEDGILKIKTAGDVPAMGICGTGLLDAVACMLELGLVDESGRLLEEDEADGVAEANRKRLETVDGENCINISRTLDEAPVYLKSGDIRQLQLAKAAVRAGCETMMKYLSVNEENIDQVLLAGAFGNYLSPISALRTGLLPGVDPYKVIPVGNSALAGARAVLLNRQYRDTSKQIGSSAEHLELSSNPDFSELFMEHMMFPED